eukprot:1154615-Pelagomonas_calceolata.AAC.6
MPKRPLLPMKRFVSLVLCNLPRASTHCTWVTCTGKKRRNLKNAPAKMAAALKEGSLTSKLARSSPERFHRQYNVTSCT